MTAYRTKEAQNVRKTAADLAANRVHPVHQSNGDEQRYATANYAMSFTKGLKHCKRTGLIESPHDYESFRAAIDRGNVDTFTTNVRASVDKTREWEAPTAGLVYDLQGPDSQAVTMPPAPALGSTELAYEMAEVYELALLRDVHFTHFSSNNSSSCIVESCDRLNKIGYKLDGSGGRPRLNEDGEITPATAFRGSSRAVDVGPYLSQFLLIGNDSVSGDTEVSEGKIAYGTLTVDQKLPVATSKDYMVTTRDWLDVQNGKNTRAGGRQQLFGTKPTRRFICTPRDLATYVHDDALYQAYLNACLILLSMKTPYDSGFNHLSGQGKLSQQGQLHDREAGGFALWGGPHILTLVTEVATRALKAVRYQKFNTHMRLRPEALAGRIEYANKIAKHFPNVADEFCALERQMRCTVEKIKQNNQQKHSADTKLLPMAFQEGSPMHPSYGAGHATVAGACVTILKAFFDTNTVLVKRKHNSQTNDEIIFAHYDRGRDQPIMFQPGYDKNPSHWGKKLTQYECEKQPLTLEGELNKLAANISIGRNMAGVHFYSDYYDSLRLGEEIAIGILEEQALCYPYDDFVMSLPTFDGQHIRIGKP